MPFRRRWTLASVTRAGRVRNARRGRPETGRITFEPSTLPFAYATILSDRSPAGSPVAAIANLPPCSRWCIVTRRYLPSPDTKTPTSVVAAGARPSIRPSDASYGAGKVIATTAIGAQSRPVCRESVRCPP